MTKCISITLADKKNKFQLHCFEISIIFSNNSSKFFINKSCFDSSWFYNDTWM